MYTTKHKAGKSVERFTARLVAKGSLRSTKLTTRNVALVSKMNSIRVLVSLVANMSREVHQVDVKNAFSHGELNEEVYIYSPPGMKFVDGIGNICRLK